MAVTDPDAHRYQRASMFIVPVDTPGVQIVRDVPTMEHPSERYGAYGGHAEIVYEDVRVPPEALLGARGAGFLIAQQRLGPGRIHHCMRWLGVSRRAFDMLCERALSRYSHGSLLGRQADGAELDRRLGRADAGGAADDAARGLEDGHRGRVGRAAGHRADQVLRRAGAARRGRPRAPGCTARSATRPTSRSRQMYRFARAARLYDGPDEVHRQSVARQILRGYEAPADGVPTEHVPTRREAARARFADLLEAVTSND